MTVTGGSTQRSADWRRPQMRFGKPTTWYVSNLPFRASIKVLCLLTPLQLKQIADLNNTINTGLLEISILGETGSVALAMNEMHKVRTAKHQKETAERDLKNLQDTSGPSGHQKLQVCDVCGAYLSRLDNDRRLADHFFGKMHMGYSDMRKGWKKLNSELKGRAPPVRHHEEEDPYSAGGRSGRGPRYGGGGGGGGGYRRRGGGRW